ncbi:MAG: hypothetical protein HUJ74_01950 [Lachnospiraceae bacterium]|nr:hypothetical protein [Lachnospiraceae bacterium]
MAFETGLIDVVVIASNYPKGIITTSQSKYSGAVNRIIGLLAMHLSQITTEKYCAGKNLSVLSVYLVISD